MQPPRPTNDLLQLRAMPEVAAALRERSQRIVQRWTEEVEKHLPHADPLTARQVRDSVPMVLEKIALALETAKPESIAVLQEVGGAHGVARFQQHYNIEEVIIEYRLLRRVIFDELYAAIGFKLNFTDAIPIDMGVDTSLHRGVITYVGHLTAELKAAAASEAKFLAFLAHDLRNNLNSATLRLAILERRLASDPQFKEETRDISAVRSSVYRTILGMERLLEAERLRRQAVTLQLGPVDLHQLADELIAQVAREAQEKGLLVENAVPPGASAHSDRDLIVLVLQNLLGNAVKYSNAGVIRIEARQDRMGWLVSVIDQGPGIAPQQVGALFEAFTRGETHGQAGMGLGLSIASHAARQLGSELKVQSTVGKGSTFAFTVPLAN